MLIYILFIKHFKFYKLKSYFPFIDSIWPSLLKYLCVHPSDWLFISSTVTNVSYIESIVWK